MNVTKIVISTQRLEFKDCGRSITVEFDKRHLFVKKRKWEIDLGTSTSLLHLLSPAISLEFSNDSNAVKRVRSSLIFLLGAIVFYFSEYNDRVPLMAPSLLLLWLIEFLPNMRRAWARWWLVVNNEFGEHVVRIRAKRRESTDPTSPEQVFVANLRKAIEDAKQKEYGLGSGA